MLSLKCWQLWNYFLALSSSVMILRNCKCGVIFLGFLIWDTCSLSVICGQRALPQCSSSCALGNLLGPLHSYYSPCERQLKSKPVCTGLNFTIRQPISLLEKWAKCQKLKDVEDHFSGEKGVINNLLIYFLTSLLRSFWHSLVSRHPLVALRHGSHSCKPLSYLY